MQQRLQTVGDDTVLEITEDQPQKRRLSQKSLMRTKSYLEQSITSFQAALGQVNAELELIATARNEAQRKG